MAFHAECWALRIGLQIARGLGIRKLQVEIDSAVLVHMVTGGALSTGPLSDLLRSIKELCERDWELSFHHVYREANFCADRLANMGIISPHSFVLYREPPDFLKDLLGFDSRRIGTFRFCSE